MLRVKTGVWSLTHMKTGASIISISGDKASAYNFAAAVADLIDWGSYDDAEKIRNVDGLAGRIKAIAEMHGPNSAAVAGHA